MTPSDIEGQLLFEKEDGCTALVIKVWRRCGTLPTRQMVLDVASDLLLYDDRVEDSPVVMRYDA